MYKGIINNKFVIIIIGAVLLTVAVSAGSDSSIKYEDPYNAENSITFYPYSTSEQTRTGVDGTFYITQASGNNIDGTYIETPHSYGITYTRSKFGETLQKTPNGVSMQRDNCFIEWVKV